MLSKDATTPRIFHIKKVKKKKNLVGNFYETRVARDINIKGICGESGISLAGI